MNNIIQNINEYFNEEKYNILVKVYILNISTEIIKTYDDKKAKQMQNYYDNLSNKVSGKVYSSDSDVVRLVTKSKRKWYGKKKKWVEVEKYYCKNYRNNIQKVTKDISMINNTMVEKIDNLINIYIQKFDIYLQNYIKLSQSLYTYIYIYYENNIKDHQNIKSGLNKYMNLLDDILINDSNEKLFSKIIGKVNINNEINYCIQNLDNNIRQIYEIYYKLNYLKDYEDFLEYPEEIKYKLENILNELKKASNQIKTKINSSYNNRILNIIKSTNNFINNINNFYMNYIIINLNNTNNNPEYFNLVKNLISESFHLSSNKINEKSNQFLQNQNKYNNDILSNDNFIKSIYNIIYEYENFVLNFTKIIEQNFIVKICNQYYNIL